jgi:hypothetical protein
VWTHLSDTPLQFAQNLFRSYFYHSLIIAVHCPAVGDVMPDAKSIEFITGSRLHGSLQQRGPSMAPLKDVLAEWLKSPPQVCDDRFRICIRGGHHSFIHCPRHDFDCRRGIRGPG